MREKPILFSGPMIRAILAGEKTQTRRVIKPQPDLAVQEVGYSFFTGPAEIEWRYGGGKFRIVKCRCPYGKPRDQLWVRETFATPGKWDQYKPSELLDNWLRPDQLVYKATERYPDGDYYKWRPSIFMPRWASRIQLQVESVRVERIQEISEKDALAEGTMHNGFVSKTVSEVSVFKGLWNEINEKRGYGWEKNPWVWVVEFSIIQEEPLPVNDLRETI